jgi:hypothetical protein
MNQRFPKVFALLMTLLFFSMIWLYVREFPVLSNTIGGRWLVAGSMAAGLLIAAGIIWRLRDRFTPWERHRPDVTFIVISAMFFAPLLGSWLNRGLGASTFQSFEFVSETPFVASGYGVLKGEKLKPTGYHLVVTQNGAFHRFKYKSQSYYPLTKRGEPIMLPVRNGLFGARVIELK